MLLLLWTWDEGDGGDIEFDRPESWWWVSSSTLYWDWDWDWDWYTLDGWHEPDELIVSNPVDFIFWEALDWVDSNGVSKCETEDSTTSVEMVLILVSFGDGVREGLWTIDEWWYPLDWRIEIILGQCSKGGCSYYL